MIPCEIKIKANAYGIIFIAFTISFMNLGFISIAKFFWYFAMRFKACEVYLIRSEYFLLNWLSEFSVFLDNIFSTRFIRSINSVYKTGLLYQKRNGIKCYFFSTKHAQIVIYINFSFLSNLVFVYFKKIRFLHLYGVSHLPYKLCANLHF